MELVLKSTGERCKVKSVYISDNGEVDFCVNIRGEETVLPSKSFKNTVNYERDYINTLQDTAELMNSDDYKDRLVAEYIQLSIRINKLEFVIGREENKKADFEPNCPLEILNDQLCTMKEYKSELEQRFKYEGIKHVHGWYDFVELDNKTYTLKNIPF